MKLYLANAFSLQMLNRSAVTRITAISKEIALKMVGGKHNFGNSHYPDFGELVNAIGHPDIATIVANDLGIENNAQRISVLAADYDNIIVAQYSGGRLPEGATLLPEGAEINYYLVAVLPHELSIVAYYEHSSISPA